MSIIHDALKKVQQGQASKSDKTPITPASTNPPNADNIFPSPIENPSHDELPIEHLAPVQNKAKSILALLCAFAFTVGSLLFCYKQLQACFPQIDGIAISFYNKLIHKKKDPNAPENLKPLARITVKPPSLTTNPLIPAKQPESVNTPGPANLPAVPETLKPYGPQTLNIHGVMSNGASNLVLIDDQVYQEGDEVDGVKIVKISLDTITVDNNGVEQTIRVKN